jgi:selenocysteine lyase/cysteine desulfurase
VSPESGAMLDMPGSGHDAVVRASPHAYNTDDDLDRLLAVVRSLRR